MTILRRRAAETRSGKHSNTTAFSRAARRFIPTAAVVAIGLSLAGAAAADSGNADVLSLASPPVTVESNGSAYTGVSSPATPIQGTMRVMLNAGDSGRVKSWTSWPIMALQPESTLDAEAWGQFQTDGSSATYSLPRPKVVDTAYPFSIAKSHYASFMVLACNDQADRLRSQGLSNGQIFSEDRAIKIAISGAIDFEMTGVAGSPIAEEVSSWEGYKKVQVTCLATADLDAATPDITSSSLVVDAVQTSNLTGECELRLSGSIISREPNTEVKFRYYDDAGQQSDLKTVTTNLGRIAIFEHVYPVAPAKKTGKIQIIGASHAFMSKWADFEVDCSAPPQDIVTTLPPRATGLEAIQTADKVMHRGLVCPAKARIFGILKGRGKVSGATALFADGQLKALKQYSIEDGQTIVVEGDYDFDWTRTEMPQQNVKFTFNVSNKGGDLVDQMEKTQNFACVKAATNDVAQGAAGGLSTGKPAPLPSQQAAVGQLSLQPAPAVAIMAPRGLVRGGQIRLSSGAANATYDLTFYRKSGGGYVAFQSARLPRQMTGPTAGFQLGALDGGRDWRIEVCPAGPAQGGCKTSDFRLPAIGAKQVQPAPGAAVPMIIAPGTLK